MNIEKFKTKHKDLINIDAVSVLSSINTIVIDRFVNGVFVCDANRLNAARTDARKMGYVNSGIGIYIKF